jgi:methionine sulfoxide reductase heme-binding subunit
MAGDSRSPAPRVAPRTLAAVAFALCLLPFGKLAVDGLLGRLGANPIAEGLNRLGFWTLTFLTLSLVPTPAKEILGLGWPVRLRRMVGLFAFSCGVLHFLWYLGVDQAFALGEIGKDIVKRKFITVGFLTLLLLVPLAITSTDPWVRRLGYRRWKALHRLVYAAAILGLIHFLWRVKADHRKPLTFAAIVGALLLLRIVGMIRRRAARAAAGTPRDGREARPPAASPARRAPG